MGAMIMDADAWILTVLGTGLGIAVLTDITTHRIPNWLILGIAIACLLLHSWFEQWNGLLLATTGLMVGLLCFLPLHLFGAMGAGDVKLMAAVGSALGPESVLVAVLLTVLSGGFIALLYIGLRGGMGAMLRRYGFMVFLLTQRQPQYLPPVANETAGLRFPYAMAIACGTAMALWIVSGQS